jgi:glycosyltransferase involved in cell wall biosynthesis
VTPTVLHILEALEGGTSRHVIDVVRSVPDVRHEVAMPSARAVGVTDTAAAGAIEEAGGRVHVVDMHRDPLRLRNVSALRHLRRLVRTLEPDIVHGHSSIGGSFARVVTGRRRIPVVYTPNGLATGRGALAIERILGKRTDRLIAVSESEGALARDLKLVPVANVCVVPNGIDLTPAPPLEPTLRARLGIGASTLLVGTIGRLVPQKAPEVYVAACTLVAERVPEAHFVLIGSGPLQHLVDAGLDGGALDGRFHQLDALEGAARALGELDVFVLVSRFEGGPYAPLEAIRAGAPVVLSDVVGNRDVVVDDDSGLVVDPEDPEGAASAITSLLLDPPRRAALAAAAHHRLTRQFSLEAMGEATAAVYSALL